VDLREELGKAFEGAESDDAGAGSVSGSVTDTGNSGVPAAGNEAQETVKASTDTTTPTEGGSDGRVRGPDGRFLPKSDKSDVPGDTNQAQAQPLAQPGTETPKATEAPAQQAQQTVDLPPSTWTAAAKAEYLKLPEVVRSEIKKRESDFQKGIGQYKQAAEFGTRMDSVIRPYIATIQQAGGQPEAVIKNLLDTAYTLRTGTPQQKAQLLLAAAQQYGADMTLFAGKPADPATGALDPNALEPIIQQRLQPVLQELNQFKTQFTSAQQQREQQEQAALSNQIEAFRTATDEKGQPKHVYFDNVRGTMAALIESGDAQTMDQAYEMACRAHPEVSKIVAAEQRQREEAQRLAEQRRLAEEAKRNNTVNAQGQGGVGIADTSKVTLRDELAGRFEGRIS
jgi:hypothetical protein